MPSTRSSRTGTIIFRYPRRTLLTALLALAMTLGMTAPAAAQTLRVAGQPVSGDWDGDGVKTAGWFHDGTWELSNSTDGSDSYRLSYGEAGDIPVVGDWNGDGRDTIGVVRGNEWILRYEYRSGADIVLYYGRDTDTPVVGDWNGDGRDTIGVVRDDTWILRYEYRRGADYVFDLAIYVEILTLERGDRGSEVAELQRDLRDTGFWVGAIDGIYGTNTEHAVLAVQKTHGLTRDGVYTPATRDALATGVRPQPRSTSGTAVEFDEDRQLLLLVRDGSTRWTFHASGGDESYFSYGGTTYWAETPNGTWDIYRQIDGWRTSHLGELYRPKYFHTDGIAVHGYTSVPAYAASHGCVRVGMDQMDWIWANNEMPIGTTVLVYGSPG